jgi:hypothetical protein
LRDTIWSRGADNHRDDARRSSRCRRSGDPHARHIGPGRYPADLGQRAHRTTGLPAPCGRAQAGCVPPDAVVRMVARARRSRLRLPAFDKQLKSPAVSLPLSLPWITGKPYSLYARVRARLPRRTTPWSAPYGFNMRWPETPTPLSTYPGLLRWKPVDGATAYDVWLLDARKVFSVNTNVADQREYYTFHQSTLWTSTVRCAPYERSTASARTACLPSRTVPGATSSPPSTRRSRRAPSRCRPPSPT